MPGLQWRRQERAYSRGHSAFRGSTAQGPAHPGPGQLWSPHTPCPPWPGLWPPGLPPPRTALESRPRRGPRPHQVAAAGAQRPRQELLWGLQPPPVCPGRVCLDCGCPRPCSTAWPLPIPLKASQQTPWGSGQRSEGASGIWVPSRHSCVVTAPGSPGAWHQGREPAEVAWSSGHTPRAASTVRGDLARQGVAGQPLGPGGPSHVCWRGRSRGDSQTPWASQQFHVCVQCHRNPLETYVVSFIPFGDCKADVQVPL